MTPRTALVAAVLMSACTFAGSPGRPDDAKPAIDAAPDAPPDASRIDGAPGAGRKKRITIDPARVDGDQPGFPVWITLVDAQLASTALADGSDIYFTLPNGTPVEWELQRWDKPTGRLDAWVRLDLDDNSPTMFDLRYGDPGPVHAPDAPKVFTDFAAVWHFESTSTVPDATATHPGTPQSINANQGVDAMLGRGIRFDGSNAEVTFTNPITGNGPHTISVWVDQTTTNDNDALVVVGNGACGESRFLHSRFDNPTMATGFYCNDWPNPGVNIVNAGWILVHWVFQGGQSTLYRDGAIAAGPFTHTGTAIATQGTGGHIGYAPGGGTGWGTNMGAHAGLDEVRISLTARGAGYVATEHNNQRNPQVFYSVGGEQQAP